MLFHLDIRPEKHEANEKEVDGKGYAGMLLNGMPGRFHIGRPVNIIKNEQGIIMRFGQALFKIL